MNAYTFAPSAAFARLTYAELLARGAPPSVVAQRVSNSPLNRGADTRLAHRARCREHLEWARLLIFNAEENELQGFGALMRGQRLRAAERLAEARRERVAAHGCAS